MLLRRALLSGQRTRSARLLLLGALISTSACNALDAPAPEGSVVVIPTDNREALLAAAPPVPISGGTLAVSADALTAVAADPDRDRVSVVNLSTGNVREVPLTAGDEPGRVVLDATGRAFVALRRGGALAVIDLASASLLERVPVCAAPRGMALAPQGLLHVACMDGRLISLQVSAPAAATASQATPSLPQPSAAAPVATDITLVRDVFVELDLRDVVVFADQIWVSTFKHAELLLLREDGQVQQRYTPERIAKSSLPVFAVDDAARTKQQAATLQPHQAYRMFADPTGNMFILHQGESDEEVAIEEQKSNTASGSPYGGEGSCSGIVMPVVTNIARGGRVRSMPVSAGVLSVDMAFSPGDQRIAVVHAGNRDADSPLRETFVNSDGDSTVAPTMSVVPGGSTVTVFDWSANAQDPSGCKFGTPMNVAGQPTAIVFRASSGIGISAPILPSWVIQSREPAQLTLLPLSASFGSTPERVIDLGGASVSDSGHDLFHRNAGGGIACASCHGEGGEDGHVWNFSSLGPRRTQSLNIGLEGTAPFHWGGDESDIDNLMTDVFVGRMGGVHQGTSRISALTRFLFALQPSAAPAPADTTAVERGRELFMSPAVGCNDCHSGDKLTNNTTVDVGTGGALQVPSLRGVAYRAPFMHNGCAPTLRDRFSPACGGASHGNTQDLAPEAIDDLVAFLQTL
jgi:mono/diheme cytochrome c family protein